LIKLHVRLLKTCLLQSSPKCVSFLGESELVFPQNSSATLQEQN